MFGVLKSAFFCAVAYGVS